MEQREWRVDFRWIKAHAGHRGNEMADKHAKEAQAQEYRGVLHENTKECSDK